MYTAALNTQYALDMIHDFKVGIFGHNNVVSMSIYDLNEVKKKTIYVQSYFDMVQAVIFKYILQNEGKFRSVLRWVDASQLSAVNYGLEATQLLEIKFTNQDTIYMNAKNVVYHDSHGTRLSNRHFALVTISRETQSYNILTLLNHLLSMELTAREFICMAFLKGMMEKDALLKSLLRHGMVVNTVSMKDFDLDEREYRDIQVIR